MVTLQQLEKLEQLELERETTMISPEFQEWKKSLNVSRMHADPKPILNARQMNSQYEWNRENIVASLAKIFYL